MNPPYGKARIIATDADLDFGMAALAVLEPRFAAPQQSLGRPPLRRVAPDLGSLLGLVFHQQVLLATGATVEAPFRARFTPADAALLAAVAGGGRTVPVEPLPSRQTAALIETSHLCRKRYSNR